MLPDKTAGTGEVPGSPGTKTAGMDKVHGRPKKHGWSICGFQHSKKKADAFIISSGPSAFTTFSKAKKSGRYVYDFGGAKKMAGIFTDLRTSPTSTTAYN